MRTAPAPAPTSAVLHELPRECLHSIALREMHARNARLEAENARLREFTLRLADRIFAAHEVLGNIAEKRRKA